MWRLLFTLAKNFITKLWISGKLLERTRSICIRQKIFHWIHTETEKSSVVKFAFFVSPSPDGTAPTVWNSAQIQICTRHPDLHAASRFVRSRLACGIQICTQHPDLHAASRFVRGIQICTRYPDFMRPPDLYAASRFVRGIQICMRHPDLHGASRFVRGIQICTWRPFSKIAWEKGLDTNGNVVVFWQISMLWGS